MAKSLILCTAFAACLTLAAADWSQGTSTFYGGPDGSDTMGKAPAYYKYFLYSKKSDFLGFFGQIRVNI
jgi:opacity protein-like surface antigen